VKVNEEPLWTSEDVARFLRIKPATVRNWAGRGILPGFKFRETKRADWRFVPARIRKFLEKQSNDKVTSKE
jgi:predicted site-specific integrase-resolvase